MRLVLSGHGLGAGADFDSGKGFGRCCGGLGGVAVARFRGRRVGRVGGRGVFLSEQGELFSHPGVSPAERSQRIDSELTSEVFYSVSRLSGTRMALLVAQKQQIYSREINELMNSDTRIF